MRLWLSLVASVCVASTAYAEPVTEIEAIAYAKVHCAALDLASQSLSPHPAREWVAKKMEESGAWMVLGDVKGNHMAGVLAMFVPLDHPLPATPKLPCMG